MSFYYLIDQHSLTSTLSFAPLMQQQIAPFPNIFFLQQEVPFIQNLNPTLQRNQINQPTPRRVPVGITRDTERSSFSEESNQRRKVKRSRRRNVEKQLESAKKNSESNIINQLFSFFSSLEKSQPVVDRAIKFLGKSQSQIQKIRAIFYNTVRLMNYKRGRRYVNKQTLTNFYTPQNFLKHLPDITQKLTETGILSLSELCLIFRVSTFYFVKHISPLAVLSSKRISMIAKKEHLKRRRLVLKGLQGNLE